MPIETDSQLNDRFEEIRDETAPDGNTKDRIYNAFKNSYDTVKSLIITYTDATATESGLMSAVNFKKVRQLPTVNFDEFELIEAPKLYLDGTSLNSTAGSVKYLGTVYTVPAATNINGGLASYVDKQFFGYITRSGTTFETSAGLTDNIGNPILDDISGWSCVYFGFYKYTGGVLTQIPFTPTLSAKLPGGETATADANGVLDLSALSTDSFTPIAENEFGTHPAFTSQHDVNAYLLSGGTYTPPTSNVWDDTTNWNDSTNWTE